MLSEDSQFNQELYVIFQPIPNERKKNKTVGHAVIGKNICFVDPSENYMTTDSLINTTLHELGHCLGIKRHSILYNKIMCAKDVERCKSNKWTYLQKRKIRKGLEKYIH